MIQLGDEFTLFCENLGGYLVGRRGREIVPHWEVPSPDLLACVIPLEDVRLKHNKFIPIKEGELSKVVEVAIVDEAHFKKGEHETKKEYQFSSTIGNPDPDDRNWFAVLEKISPNEDVLTIVQRRRF